MSLFSYNIIICTVKECDSTIDLCTYANVCELVRSFRSRIPISTLSICIYMKKKTYEETSKTLEDAYVMCMTIVHTLCTRSVLRYIHIMY